MRHIHRPQHDGVQHAEHHRVGANSQRQRQQCRDCKSRRLPQLPKCDLHIVCHAGHPKQVSAFAEQYGCTRPNVPKEIWPLQISILMRGYSVARPSRYQDYFPRSLRGVSLLEFIRKMPVLKARTARPAGSRSPAGRMETAALCGNSPPWRFQPHSPRIVRRGQNQKGKNSL